MKNVFQRAILLLLSGFLLLSIGCKKDSEGDLSNTKTIKFTTLLSYENIPDTIPLRVSLESSMQVSSSKFLTIIDNKLYQIENGNYTPIADRVITMDYTSDGVLCILGYDVSLREKLMISTDYGETFITIPRFVRDNGVILYNGIPNNIIVRKLNDGTYLMWAYVKYKYNLGGTGFSTDRFEHYVFTSSNGTDWDLYSSETALKSNSEPISIDNNGTIYIVQYVSDGQTYTKKYYFKSTDFGKTMTQQNSDVTIPNAISFSNTQYGIGVLDPDENENLFHVKENGKWVSVNCEIDRRTFPNHINFTPKGKILITGAKGIYVSN